MPKFGPIWIDNQVLDAIRDDRLVVFAGAGVSMGPPANLPDFDKLAKDIAAGTGLARSEKEPVDHFLGRLSHQGVEVQRRAAQLLSDSTSAPTVLHLDLMRLFRKPDRVRLVTTNFDLHFETAAQTVFGQCPEVFRAPALPLGRGFRGLVHVHGALTHPLGMVLTDVDFGRGYLTEGWARRFLVDVFRTYTVLFVGYSHNDVVMNYLARALPADGVKKRFVLTEEDGDWKLLGITPIPFHKGTGADEFKELYDGVRCLAERTTRGALDWQSRLFEIGSRMPPIDDETAGEIEQALREVSTTRFLVQGMLLPEWPKWLNTGKHLNALFDNTPLSERDKLLADWLVEHYAIDQANVVIALIAAHNMRLSPEVWWAVARELAFDDQKALDENTLARWIATLLPCAPDGADGHMLSWLAERCANQGSIQLTLKVFLFMGDYRLTIKPGIDWLGSEEDASRFEVQTPLHSDHYELNEVWEKHLKPNLAVIAQPLLSGISRRLEDIHHALLAWNKAGHDWDGLPVDRSAIEPHPQDDYPGPLDVLIDAGRDALEWLASQQSTLLDAWMEILIVSEVPLLRRLAIHALTVHPSKTADDRLNWLLAHGDLYASAEHHEVHRAVALAYPSASSEARQTIIDTILRHQLPSDEDRTATERTARAHFKWLDWLHRTDPTCALVQAVLVPIKTAYPDWQPNDHPDLTSWTVSGVWSRPGSPWSVAQLLAKPPVEQLDDLLNFNSSSFDGPDRNGLCSAIQEACKQEPSWAMQLDEALSVRFLWDSDLWAPMLRGLREAEMAPDLWKCTLSRIARPELHAGYASGVANLLYELVRDGGKPFSLDLLDQANDIAFDLWQTFPRKGDEGEVDDWSSWASNRPAGVVVQFWLHGLSLSLHEKPKEERRLPTNYRRWFTAIAQDESIIGGLGRSVLARHVAYLFVLDETWTREYIIPWFSSTDADTFKQAWHGFLVGGRLNPSLAETLQLAFMLALQRLDTDLADRRQRFIEFFSALVVFHIDDPTPLLLPALFTNGSPEDRIKFASQVGWFLQQMEEHTRQALWERWLRRYWENRLHSSVPLPLDEPEIRTMLGWLPHLGDMFPQGVFLAVTARYIRIEHSHLFSEMQKSDLVTRFPAEAAELLIYLCHCRLGYHITDLISKIASRLPPLDPQLQHRLDEAMAHAGIGLRQGSEAT